MTVGSHTGSQGRAPGHTGLGPILRRAVQREVALPTAVALGGLSVAFLTKSLLAYADWIVNRGLGAVEVAQIAGLELLPVLAQTLPFALLIGVLVALGRLKADLELLAMETIGLSRLQLVRPVVGVALAGGLLAAILSIWAAPLSRARLESNLERIARERPGAMITAGRVAEFGDRQLLAREASADGTELRGVLLWMPDLAEAVFGERGRLGSLAGTEISLQLEDASILGSPVGGGQHVEVAHFETRLEFADEQEAPGDRIGALSTSELMQFPAGPDLRRAQAELHRRFAHPAAALLLGVLAAPLALARRRFSRSSGAVAGLFLTLGYYGLVQLADAMLRDPGSSVAWAVWTPPSVVLVLLIILLLRLAGDPIDEEPDRSAPERANQMKRPVGVRGVLDRYVLGVYLGAAALSFGALFVAYFLIDVLERLEWFARHQAEIGEIAWFYAARTPLLASRVVPMGLLAGSALTVSLLVARGELLAMQTCGIRLGRALTPVLMLSLLVVPLDFWLNDSLVTRSNAWADRIKVERIKDRSEGSATEAWYRMEGQLVRASRSGLATGRIPDLVVFEIGPTGLPSARIHAREARHVGDGEWELIDARAVLISDSGLQTVDPPLRYAFGEARRAQIDPMHHSVGSLAVEIEAAEESGFPVVPLRIAWHRKLAGPFACLLLPAISLLVVVRSRRPPSAARNLVLCVALGVAYLLVGDVAASLGQGGQLSPVAAGWTPPLMAVSGLVMLLGRPRA
ncbi:MAG: YjgP/YjgQ family permease [bacterium]|nr:YjgP/YjgQ family permease [bacterium]